MDVKEVKSIPFSFYLWNMSGISPYPKKAQYQCSLKADLEWQMDVEESSLLYIRFSVQSETFELSLNATEGAAMTTWPLQGHSLMGVRPINRHMEADV